MEQVDDEIRSGVRMALEDVLDVATDGAVESSRNMMNRIYSVAVKVGSVNLANAFEFGSKYYKAVLVYAEKRSKVLFD